MEEDCGSDVVVESAAVETHENGNGVIAEKAVTKNGVKDEEANSSRPKAAKPAEIVSEKGQEVKPSAPKATE